MQFQASFGSLFRVQCKKACNITRLKRRYAIARVIA